MKQALKMCTALCGRLSTVRTAVVVEFTILVRLFKIVFRGWKVSSAGKPVIVLDNLFLPYDEIFYMYNFCCYTFTVHGIMSYIKTFS